MKILIKGGRVIDPKAVVDKITDLAIENGIITKIGSLEPTGFDQVIDATDKWVTPAFVDTHVHLREPGFEDKEDLISGTRAGLKGGFSDLVAMPNTRPTMDTLTKYEDLLERIENKALIRVHPTGAITMGLAGKEQAQMQAMGKAGAIAFTDDGHTTMDDTLMENAFLVAKSYGRIVTTHSEDHDVTAHIKDRPAPNTAESDVVVRDIRLAEKTGGALHVGHVSTKEALKAIKEARVKGIDVSCEVTPHHIALAHGEDGIDAGAGRFKVNPPIRSQADRQAVIQAIQEGTIEMIATDHAPHEMHTKQDSYETSSYGFTGLETSFAVAYTALVRRGHISEAHLIKLMTYAPAKRFGIEAGNLDLGKPANLVLLDPHAKWTVKGEAFVSKGKNTPFEGMTFYGKVTDTWVNGEHKLQGGHIHA